MKKVFSILIVALLFTGCDVMNRIGGAYQLSQSEYRYHSLNNIQLAGINLGNASSISVSNLASIATLLRFIPAKDRKSTRLNSSHVRISYAVFCLKTTI